MIIGFRSKVLRRFAEHGDLSKLPVSGVAIERVADQLEAIAAASSVEQLDVPGWFFHPLKGRPRRYSLRVTADWRLTFGFDPPDATDVDLEDYH